MIIGISGLKESGKSTVAKLIQLIKAYPQGAIEAVANLNNLEDPTVIKILNSEEWKRKSFAKPIKKLVCSLTGYNMKDFNKKGFKNMKLGKEWTIYYIIDKISNKRLSKSFSKREQVEKYKEDAFGRTLDDPYLPDKVKIVEEELTIRRLMQLIGTDAGKHIVSPLIWINGLFKNYDDSEVLKEYEIKYEDKWLIDDVRFFDEIDAIRERGGVVIRVEKESKNNDSHRSESELENYKEWDFIIENDGNLNDLKEKVEGMLTYLEI